MMSRSVRMLEAKREAALSSSRRQPGGEDAEGTKHSAAAVWANEVAVTHERLKNLALWRSPPATLRIFATLAMTLFALAFVDTDVLARFSGLVFGIFFFFLWPFFARFPRLSPLPDLSAGTPDDDECAMEAIRRRAAADKPVLENSVMLLALRNVGEDDVTETKDGHYKGLLGPTQGTLVVSSHRMTFSDGEVEGEQLFQARLEKINELIKIGDRGLRIVVKGGAEAKFDALHNRDEAFNRILAICPIQWQEIGNK